MNDDDVLPADGIRILCPVDTHDDLCACMQRFGADDFEVDSSAQRVGRWACSNQQSAGMNEVRASKEGLEGSPVELRSNAHTTCMSMSEHLWANVMLPMGPDCSVLIAWC
mmetsp:Transcript_34605/g.76903  ORF Transcript_34605/g.76903 Transcript_34605/m.76903 type:complete len:110 (+) Transcript_34605:732-1061(+)